MKCENCGKRIEDDSEFCRFCGNAVNTPDDFFEIEDENKEINPLYAGAAALMAVFIIALSIFAFIHVFNEKKVKETDVLGEVMPPDAEMIVWDESNETEPAEEASTAESSEETEVDEALYDPEFTDDEGIHKYELIVKDLTWTEAFQDCVNKGGYLVHLNTEEEIKHVQSQISKEGYDNVYFYIGASRNEDSDNYYWVNSEAKHFGKALNSSREYEDCWLYGEPSFFDTDFGTGEFFLDMLNHPDEEKWFFNDIPDDGLYSFLKGKKRIGYICEYDK